MESIPADRLERYLAYADKNRTRVRLVAVTILLVIALADWGIDDLASLGFLYLIPVVLISPLLTTWQILAISVVCTFLREQFHPLAWKPNAEIRIATGLLAFGTAGFFIRELDRKRRAVIAQVLEVRHQSQLREDAENQLRTIIETSPLAILTIDAGARVTLANDSAHQLLAVDHSLTGADIRPYLPILGRLLRTPRADSGFRTTVECKGHRDNHDVFMAHLFVSSCTLATGPALAAVVWDASENLRDREGTGLDSMMQTSRVVIGAVSHELRNLCAAASTTHHALGAAAPVTHTPEYQTLGTILGGLGQLASSGLQLAASRTAVVADLGTVLDEARIVIDPAVRELGGSIAWQLPAEFPLIRADHHSLLQVFLNLARNSQRAIEHSPVKRIEITAVMESDLVLVRFRDTGCGVAHPEDLFRPFQPTSAASGLGLYVSRAILRAHGGDLFYEPASPGTCFTLQLWPAEENEPA